MRLLQPLRRRDFALLFAGSTISLIGDGVYTVALAFQVYALDNSPGALSLVLLAYSAGLVVCALVAGVVRRPRRPPRGHRRRRRAAARGDPRHGAAVRRGHAGGLALRAARGPRRRRDRVRQARGDRAAAARRAEGGDRRRDLAGAVRTAGVLCVARARRWAASWSAPPDPGPPWSSTRRRSPSPSARSRSCARPRARPPARNRATSSARSARASRTCAGASGSGARCSPRASP